MTELIPFKKEHYKQIVGNSDQNFLAHYVSDDDLSALEQNPLSVTCVDGEKILGIGGIVLSHDERGEAWGIVAPGVRSEFIKIHRAVKGYLAVATLRRIEAVVHTDYAPGHRWVKALGFELEAPCMKAHSLQGKDAALYAITKGATHGG